MPASVPLCSVLSEIVFKMFFFPNGSLTCADVKSVLNASTAAIIAKVLRLGFHFETGNDCSIAE